MRDKAARLMIAMMGLLVACDGGGPVTAPPIVTAAQGLSACPDGEMLDGVDVSKYQKSINWSQVAGAGIAFAFIRVSNGAYDLDPYFDFNWAQAKVHGVVRGTYQFFRADQDPVAQAQLLLDEMGPLEPGDLPPVCDVETSEDQDKATVVSKVQVWLDVVEDALGVKPIIYTSPGMWATIANSPDFGDYPLWVAHWGVSCPTMPTGWSDWVFWQTSETGVVPGITEHFVDTNHFNGTLSDLLAITVQAEPPPDPPLQEETAVPCPVPASGYTVIEEDGPCARRLGPVDPVHYTDVSGHGGHAWWTTVDTPAPEHHEGVEWLLDLDVAGTYKVWAHIPAGLDGLATAATYEVTHGDEVSVISADQATAGGAAVLLGSFDFAAGAGGQGVRALDSYAVPEAEGQRLALDAIELGPATLCSCTEAGAVETWPCGEGGTMSRACDGCQWSAWSACDVAPSTPDAGDTPPTDLPEVEVSAWPPDVDEIGPEVTGATETHVTPDASITTHHYTSSVRARVGPGDGCASGTGGGAPLTWSALALVLVALGRRQPKSASKSATP